MNIQMYKSPGTPEANETWVGKAIRRAILLKKGIFIFLKQGYSYDFSVGQNIFKPNAALQKHAPFIEGDSIHKTKLLHVHNAFIDIGVSSMQSLFPPLL